MTSVNTLPDCALTADRNSQIPLTSASLRSSQLAADDVRQRLPANVASNITSFHILAGTITSAWPQTTDDDLRHRRKPSRPLMPWSAARSRPHLSTRRVWSVFPVICASSVGGTFVCISEFKSCSGQRDAVNLVSYTVRPQKNNDYFLSASLYVSKRGAYWDRLCRDVVGCWSLVVTRVHGAS